MISLTPPARRSLERYLKRVRLSLQGTSVDASEVERDVREHIQDALSDRTQLVDDAELGAVLDRLGSPAQWVPEEETPFWRRVLGQLQHGPEDWRLAYLCFALWFVGFVTSPFGGALLWIPAYFMGRAAASISVAQGETLGPRGWLVYPAVVLPSLALLAALLTGPFVPVVIWGVQESMFDRLIGGIAGELKPLAEVAAQSSLFGIAIGVWWMLLAPLSLLVRRPLRALLFPLADHYERRHAMVLALLGLGLAAICVTVLLLV